MLCLALAPPACNGTGGGGVPRKKTILLDTVYQDQVLGEDTAKELEAEMGVYESPALTAYVAKIGNRMLPYAPLRPFAYQFSIVDQMAPNAFSLPGGHIYVSRGLIALAANEDELAGVIGHEIIHAAERHVAAHQELTRRTSPLLLPWIRMARLAAYSRDHERAADRGGQEIAARAGYDPAALSNFLKHLGDIERLTAGYSRLTSYFGTHPGTTERIAATAADATTIPWKRDPARPVADGRAYLRRIAGITLGTHPKEGVFREEAFIHADLDFRMLFPRGWELVNSHAAVGAISQTSNARIFLTAGSATVPIEGEEEDADPEHRRPLTAREAADRFIENPEDEFDVGVVKAQPLDLGGIEAYRIEIRGILARTGIRGYITFIPHNGVMFRLASVAPSAVWSRYVGRALAVERSFRPLTDEERNSIEISRLRIVEAMEGEDLASVTYRTANSWTIGRTAVLNSVFVNQQFHAGDLLKIAHSAPYRPERKATPEAAEPGSTKNTSDPETPGTETPGARAGSTRE